MTISYFKNSKQAYFQVNIILYHQTKNQLTNSNFISAINYHTGYNSTYIET